MKIHSITTMQKTAGKDFDDHKTYEVEYDIDVFLGMTAEGKPFVYVADEQNLALIGVDAHAPINQISGKGVVRSEHSDNANPIMDPMRPPEEPKDVAHSPFTVVPANPLEPVKKQGPSQQNWLKQSPQSKPNVQKV